MTNRDINDIPLDELIADKPRAEHELAPLDATLQSEMLATLAMREAGLRRAAALRASRQHRRG